MGWVCTQNKVHAWVRSSHCHDNPLLYFADGTGCYGVRVVNGKMGGAGVDNYSVFVNLVGTKGSTGKVHLHGITQCLVGGIKKNTHQDLIIKTWATLGDIQVVILGIDGKIGLHNTWFVQYTVVYDFFGEHDKEGVQFPCYHWIKPNQTVTTTAATSECSEGKRGGGCGEHPF